jgi:LCP family protein required for cell wall assembly
MQNQAKPSRKKYIGQGLGIFLGLLLLASLFAYPYLRQRWSAPLGPSLQLPTLTPTVELVIATPSATAIAENAPDQEQATLPAPVAIEATAMPTATPEPLCGGPPAMVVLGIGADSDFEYRYGLADAMRVARVDFINAKVSVLSVPRDLWVEIPDIEQHYGITHGKLNQAYFYGSPGMGYYDGPGESPGLLARTLDLNFGLRVDHYGAVNMETFVKIVDAVGGIDIYLANDVDGRPIDDQTEDMGYFYAGQQHFTGDEALRFSRIRKKYNDFTRMDNQTLVLCSLRDKLLNPSVLPKIPQIVGAFQGAVQTDLSLEQLTQLACLLPHIEREDLLFASFPQDMLVPSRVYSEALKNETFVLDVDNAEIRSYVERFLDGSWPTEPKEPTCP